MRTNPRFRTYSTCQTYRQILADTLLGRSAQGEDLTRFEEAVKAQTGSPFALCMPQARVGIFMAIRGLIKPGQKVVLSPYTIYDVVNMVICAGAVPVFADIDRATHNVNLSAVKELLDERTGAVLVTHMHGLALDLRDLAETCRQKNIPLIEDAAQAFGARVNQQPVGTFGDVGIYSFGLYKNINAFYGGMVVTRRKELYERLRAELEALPLQKLWPLVRRVGYGLMTEFLTWPPFFRLLPFRVFRYAYLHDIESLNRRVREENNPQAKRVLPPRYLRRMRPVQARLALKALPRVEADAAVRLGFARLYRDGLSDVKELLLPPFREDGSHVYIQYPIQYADRKALVKHMMRMGCDVAVQHFRNCAEIDCFAEYRRECPNTHATANATIVLPTYPKYGREDVERNIRAIRTFFGKETASSRISVGQRGEVVQAQAAVR